MRSLLLTYYGDDFTGSTDALEFLSRAGVKTVLFIKPPTPEQLEQFHGLQAVGVAGISRAMKPREMEQELYPAFTALNQIGARHVHYKVCSTFDSSPSIGSIGKAIDVGAEIFQSHFVPLLVAAPALGRHCVFGNLFARLGIGSKGNIYRLDRHPSMSRHPVTPADESDLRLHLARQTDKKIGLLDILHLQLPLDEAAAVLENIIDGGSEIVLFDAIQEDQMSRIGQLIDAYAENGKTLFSVGSSGIEMAIGAYWQEQEIVHPQKSWPDPGNAGPLLVISGSCSPVTAGQITWAVANGFVEVPVTITALSGENGNELSLSCDLEAVISYLQKGRSVIVHTSRGADDERIIQTAALCAQIEMDKSETARLLGTFLGRIAREVVTQTGVKRLVIAGGDTSGYAAREMGIEAVEMMAPLAPGAPLCKAYAPGSPLDGLQVNFKGGQVGGEDYFGLALQGTTTLNAVK
ncbi:four-carbon acid sugar kinase family protein [Chitinophagaceae bacterium LB-8]|uniref:Four-carbon acid sugar kinase family protein n=1 Tax=Paraflavisolibacter caeni TaxID=2982496 RepID=A0A9X2XUP3_9BACT|nr:four-carbon acid sugar kinase family protein [Paraflavisolibacter caeni]MCU7548847.1 four-carbon acid sugar kinase family protein [Paraflavisolibacter caeni]